MENALKIFETIGKQWPFLIVLFVIIVIIIKWKLLGQIFLRITKLKLPWVEMEIPIKSNDQIIKENNIDGIRTFYSQRMELDEKWEAFYLSHKNPQHVVMMGQSLGKTFDNVQQSKRFIEWCNSGTEMKILLLSPTANNSIQLRSVGEGMLNSIIDIPTNNLKKKIEKTQYLIERNLIEKISNIDNRPLIRYSQVDLPYSLIVIDEDMYITFYGTEAEANNQPTMKIYGKDSKAYLSFIKEFENIWLNFSTVTSHREPIIASYANNWEQYIKLKESFYKNSRIVQPPLQAILLPTYKCSNSCSHCMFKEKRIEDIHMPISDLQTIVNQLIDYGVRYIEISGGGEPMEYNDFFSLCVYLYNCIKLHPDLKIGILTNGLHLHKFKKLNINGHSVNLLDCFNDYIRISRLDKASISGHYADFDQDNALWKRNVIDLIDLKNHEPIKYRKVKIGLKYLLTNANKNDFVKQIGDDLRDNHILEIDHFRFRSAREVESEVISTIEQKIYYLLRTSDKLKTNFETRVSLSLPNTYYPRNYKCWISPMHTLISPDKEVYSCCNYLVNKKNTLIGKIDNDSSFKDIWESNEHISVRKKLGTDICSCNEFCSNCRYAEVQQTFEQIIASLDDRGIM